MLIDFLKNILYVFVICVFLYLILGQTVVEGMEGASESTTSESNASASASESNASASASESNASASTTDAETLEPPVKPAATEETLEPSVKATITKKESEQPTKVTSSDVSELFERVNTQSDIIRTFKGSFDPIIPLKIDGTGDQRIILLKNIKLLLNNGVFKNETDLKDYEYFGNKAINTLVSEVNNLNLESPTSILDIDKKEVDYANRTRDIIEEHKKIIDLELKRRAK
jgi:hypothetical protein